MSNREHGATWIKDVFNVEMSPLGIQVAELLNDAFYGIYHLDRGKLAKVDWGDTYVVSVQIYASLSTYDNDNLTRLVVLSHDRCLRLTISARTVNTLELMFHQRQRGGSYSERLPTMEDHLTDIRRYHPAPEQREVEDA